MNASSNTDINLSLICVDGAHPIRLDALLAQSNRLYSRMRYRHWIETGCVTVNGQVILKPRHLCRLGDRIELEALCSAKEPTSLIPESMDLDIIDETHDFIVVQKPAGCVTHPAHGHWRGTLANGLVGRYPELLSLPRAGLIHRLDQYTSGLLLVARHARAYMTLTAMMRERFIHRRYVALVCGRPPPSGVIDYPISRHAVHRQKMAAMANGKPSKTYYEVTQYGRYHAALCVRLETGRTHQIRVHMAWIGHPVLGDVVYGRASHLINRQALHARWLSWTWNDQAMNYQCPIPDDMQQVLNPLCYASA